MAYNPATEKFSMDELFIQQFEATIPNKEIAPSNEIPWGPIIITVIGSIAITCTVVKVIKVYNATTVQAKQDAVETKKHQVRQDIDIAMLKDKVEWLYNA